MLPILYGTTALDQEVMIDNHVIRARDGCLIGKHHYYAPESCLLGVANDLSKWRVGARNRVLVGIFTLSEPRMPDENACLLSSRQGLGLGL